MLKKFYATQAEIPEGQASFYVEKDGKFSLDVEGGIEDVTQLKTALTSERGITADLTKKLKGWSDSGIESPEKVRDLLTRVDALSKLDPKQEAERIAAEKVDLIRTQLATEAGAKEGVLQTRNDKLTKQLSKQLIDTAAYKVLTETHKGDANLLMPHIRNSVRMVENTNGDFVAQVLDEAGNVRVGTDAKDMNISDLISEMKGNKSFARAFDGTGASGSGGGGGGGNGTVENPTTIDGNNPFETGRHAEGLANGTVVIAES